MCINHWENHLIKKKRLFVIKLMIIYVTKLILFMAGNLNFYVIIYNKFRREYRIARMYAELFLPTYYYLLTIRVKSILRKCEYFG